MRIQPKEMLFGEPILNIRKVVRLSMNDKWFTKEQYLFDEIAKLLDRQLSIAKQVLEQLIIEDYLSVTKEKIDDNFYWKVSETEKGRRFGITNANPPISREKADQLLKELLERVAYINSQDLCFRVQSIKVFGSYLSEQSILGDLDIAFKLQRNGSQEEFNQKRKERTQLAFENGRRFSTFYDELSWPEKEVILLLKTKKKGLSLHNEENDEIVQKTECLLVYENK